MAEDSPRLPGICLTLAQRALERQKEIGRLLKSLRNVAPDRHDQAVEIYAQAMLEHGQLTGELNQLTNTMQAARICKQMLPDQEEMTAGLVPVPCRTPPEVPQERQEYLVLEAECQRVTTERWPRERVLAARRCAGEKGEDEA